MTFGLPGAELERAEAPRRRGSGAGVIRFYRLGSEVRLDLEAALDGQPKRLGVSQHALLIR
jgi:hypothetical protein